jgi:cyclase
MQAKKIIACLDIKDGRIVKGINFVGLRDVGDPVQAAQHYVKQGADELVFLDITATAENRKTIVELAKRVSNVVTVPFTVGGGIHSVEDAKILLDSGVDKVSINSAAIKNPQLITDIANTFGKEHLVIAIDTKLINGKWYVVTEGGNKIEDIDAVEWAKEVEKLGAGEILLTSMDKDGTEQGFDIQVTKAVCDAVNIPVTASGGAGNMEDFFNVFKQTKVSAALGASVFHFGQVAIPELKKYLKANGIAVIN